MCDEVAEEEIEETHFDCVACERRQRINELERIGYQLLNQFREQGIVDSKVIIGLLAEELGLFPVRKHATAISAAGKFN